MTLVREKKELLPLLPMFLKETHVKFNEKKRSENITMA